jgi:hypothetical protein
LHIEAVELNALARNTINTWSLNPTTVVAHVVPAQIVGKYDQDMWLAGWLCMSLYPRYAQNH